MRWCDGDKNNRTVQSLYNKGSRDAGQQSLQFFLGQVSFAGILKHVHTALVLVSVHVKSTFEVEERS